MVLSPQVCYVCGGPGAVLVLHTRPTGNDAYFPFLESHEAPNGARPPTKDGVVDSCNICFAFLQQQWESYERTHTPLVKRLYWMKRLDNRPFTGAEMRLQGEYAAQVMGLQYYPSNTGTMSPYEYSPIDAQKERQKAEASGKGSPSSIAETFQGPDDFEEDDTGALDLSLTSSTSKDDSVMESKIKCTPPRNKDKFVCFTCKCYHDIKNCRSIYSKFVKKGEPYFSFLEHLGRSEHHDNYTQYMVCRVCQDSLFEQWKIFEYKNLPEHMRNYCIKNEPVFSNQSKSIDVSLESEKNLNVSGDASGSSGSDVCFLCNQSTNRSSMKMLNTRPPQEKSSKHSMFFPFIEELKRPASARPIDQFGRVVTCRACYSYLQRQWQTYQQDKVSLQQRNYVLRPSNEHDFQGVQIKKEISSASSANNVTDPLNIEISSTNSSSKSKNQSSYAPPLPSSNEGLLAIAPHVPQQMIMPGMYHPGHIFYNSYQDMYMPSPSASVSSDRYDNATASSIKKEKSDEHYDKSEGKPTVPREMLKDRISVTDSFEKVDCSVVFSLLSRLKNKYIVPSTIVNQVDLYNGKNQESKISEDRALSTSSPYDVPPGRQCDSHESSLNDASERMSTTSSGHPSRRQSQASPGLTGGGKPPPLNMVNSSIPRTTVTVPPLNPVSPGSSITSTAALSASRQQQHSSSFAAALRKLAKQAEGPESSPIDPVNTSDSSNTSPREPLEKRTTAQSMSYNATHHLPTLGGAPSSAPPVVTIAPTQSHSSYLGSERKSADRTPTANMLDPLGIKPDRDKTTPSHDRRDDDRPHSKDSAALSARMTPHPVMPSVSASSSMHEDPSRGFQPYRAAVPGEEALRHVMASAGGLHGIDPAAYSAAYAQAAAAAAALSGGYPSASPYGGIRLDDPMLLERYRLMQSSMAGYPYTSGFIAHPGSLSQYLGQGSRYPPELLSQMGYPYLYPGAKLPEHLSPGSAERLKTEEEMRRACEREVEREREKERERCEKERERREKEERAVEREKERQIKEAERRHSTGSSSGGYSAERLLAGSSSSYPQPQPAHEPLNLKRGPDDDHHLQSAHHSSSSHHGSSSGHTSHQRVPPAHSSSSTSQRQLNGDRDLDRHVSSYRTELGSRGDSSSRSNIPTLGVPPLSVPKPHNLSSQNKDNRESSHHSFHRPFEITGHSSSGERPGGRDHLGGSMPPVSNGYDRNSYAEYERRLLMEREKMLAEHRASQEKSQQQRTSSSSGGSQENRRSSHDSDSSNKQRAGYPPVHDGKDRVADHHHQRERENSSGKTLNLTSQSHHHQQQHHHHHNNHEKHTSSSLHKSPHKSLLSSSSSSSGNSTSSSNNNNTKYPPPAASSHHPQFPFSSMSGKDNKHASISESQVLPKHTNYSDSYKMASHPTNASQSALTSLQNFSNSKVPSSFGSVIHSAADSASTEEQRKLKESGIVNHARLNGALQSHSRTHEPSLNMGTDLNKRKDVSLQNHKMLNNVRSPKRVRPQHSGLNFSKEKLEEGEPAVKRLHMTDFDGSTERDLSSMPFNPDDLNREPDYRQKACFLFSLQLEPVSPEKRKEMEFCQKVCEWDKIRRQAISDNPPSKCNKEGPPVNPNQYCTARLAQLVTEALLSKKVNSTMGNQENSSKTQLQPANVSAAVITPTATTTAPSISGNQQPLQATRSVIYHQNPSSLSDGNKPLLSHHFAQEFHESVLKETQQQRASKAYNNKHENSNQDVRYTMISSDGTISQPPSKQQQQQSGINNTTSNSSPANNNSHHPLLPSSLQSMQNMTSQLLGTDSTTMQQQHQHHGASPGLPQNLMTSNYKAMTSPHGSQHSISDIGEDNTMSGLKWPGVEAIMMAYQKHIEEVNTEKQILQEQCESLKNKNLHLNKTAEELSKKMSEFLENKEKAKEERTRHQNELDNFRKLLSALKR